MNPDLIAKIAQISSVLEVSGHPKPGNVHRTQDFDDMIFEDFLISGVVIGDSMKKAAERGQKYKNDTYLLEKIKLGEIIKEAVLETDKWIGNNTNLGIVLLLTPLAAAAGMSEDFTYLRENVGKIMDATTPEDAVNLYDAINIADAGGMGEHDELDVADKEARDKLIIENINMYEVLHMSSKWDSLSYELTNLMPVTFETGFPTFRSVKPEYGINKAVLQTFLTILSKNPDTLISRKYGNDMARMVTADADSILQNGGALTSLGLGLLHEFDKQLVRNKLNPGTTADLTASSIMAAYLNEFGF